MKKVLSALVLTSFLAVLVLPAIALAADPICPQCSNPTVQCRCEGATWPAGAIIWCFNGIKAYNNPGDCQAAISAAGGTTGSGGAIDTPEKLVGLIDRIGGYIFQILLAIAGIFLIAAGFLFVTAGGNPEQVTKARQMLINALIGVAVAVGAQGLKTIVINLVS